MALINHDGLARLSSNMEHMELGETIVRTKIELFSARRPERQMSDKLDMNLQSSPSWPISKASNENDAPPTHTNDELCVSRERLQYTHAGTF